MKFFVLWFFGSGSIWFFGSGLGWFGFSFNWIFRFSVGFGFFGFGFSVQLDFCFSFNLNLTSVFLWTLTGFWFGFFGSGFRLVFPLRDIGFNSVFGYWILLGFRLDTGWFFLSVWFGFSFGYRCVTLTEQKCIT